MRKYVTLTLVTILILSSLTIIKPVNSEITKPSVPEFTLRLAHHPYDVPPVTTIDPYTGKSVTTQEGYHIENRSIEVVINNQPFSAYNNLAGNNIALLYNIRWKGHFEDSWNYYAGVAATLENTRDYVHAWGSTDTVVVGGLSWNEESTGYNFFIAMPSEGSQGGQVDFQVKALFGYSNQVYAGDMIPLGATYYYNFTGSESDWSNTKTFNLDSNSTTSSPAATVKPSQTQNSEPTPTQSISPTGQLFGFDWQIIALIITIVVIVAITIVSSVSVFTYRKRQKPKPAT